MYVTVRKALPEDVPIIAEIAEQRRIEYQKYQPVFWHKADDAIEKHRPFLEQAVQREDVIVLVHEQAGVVDGFVIADFVPSPPVYTAGLTCRIDDFRMLAGKDWAEGGQLLLDEVMREAKLRGAAQIVVVCANLDQPKRAMLSECGLTIASEWYVKPL